MVVSYEKLAPLLYQQEVQGHLLRCTFRCPLTGVSVQARAALQNSFGTTRVIRRAFQGELLLQTRRAVVDAVHSAVIEDGAAEEIAYSEHQRRAAVVRAFHTVSSFFVWEPRSARWISAQAAEELMTGFQRQLGTAPAREGYDRWVVARMLVETMKADGRIAPQEQQLIAEFLWIGRSLEELMAQPDLSPAELGRTSPGAVRETMLMLAWAMALTDSDLAGPEQARLQQFSQGLELSLPRTDELKKLAQLFVVYQALERSYERGEPGPTERAQVLDLAGLIGLSEADALQVEKGLRRRLALL